MITNKSTKNEGTFENMGVLTGKQFEDFRQKKEQEQYSRPFKNTQWDGRTLKPSTEYRPCKQ